MKKGSLLGAVTKTAANALSAGMISKIKEETQARFEFYKARLRFFIFEVVLFLVGVFLLLGGIFIYLKQYVPAHMLYIITGALCLIASLVLKAIAPQR